MCARPAKKKWPTSTYTARTGISIEHGLLPRLAFVKQFAKSSALTAHIYTDQALAVGSGISLPPVAARHVQVLRLQPGNVISLFNGLGLEEGQYTATIESMGRSDVRVLVGDFSVTQMEAPRAVHLAVGMPANERMDWLVEKATELGVASIAPLMTERSVLRLSGERAEKKRLHWQGIAAAACEQCGRNRVPLIHAPMNLPAYLKACADTQLTASSVRLLLSLQTGTQPIAAFAESHDAFTLLSGPEGGLSSAEEAAADAAGFLAGSAGAPAIAARLACHGVTFAPLFANRCMGYGFGRTVQGG
jgi:16S rRNA (uracil1498-N3)-methyltransferase